MVTMRSDIEHVVEVIGVDAAITLDMSFIAITFSLIFAVLGVALKPDNDPCDMA